MSKSAIDFYILDAGGALQKSDAATWATWLDTSLRDESCVIARDVVHGYIDTTVQTIVVGLVLTLDRRRIPLVFMSIVVRDGIERERWYYENRTEALRGHADAIRLAEAENEATA
jgi:hypothetical protein